ncbi:MAG: TldD/PmbA family protein [Rikenellaceae bacterium]|nr:TldD/PmbA family protein [Rikenellaceae bacterium]
MKQENEKATIQLALETAKKSGAAAVRITYNKTKHSSYTIRNDKLDRLQQATGSSLFLQLYVDGRYGTFSTNRMESEELKKFIAMSVETTKLLTEDPYRSLPDTNLYYKGGCDNLGQYDYTFSKISAEHKIDIAKECNSEILGKDKRLLNVSSEYGDYEDHTLIIDSQGFFGETDQTNFTVSTECSVKGKGDARPEGWWYESSLFFDDLTYKGCGEKAFERAASKLGPRKIKSKKYNMVVENTVSSRLISPIINALNGANIQQNNSFLNGKLGERVFSPLLEIYDDAHLPGAFGSRYFDSEGLATLPGLIVDKGVISTYFVNTYYSKKTGLPVTIESPSLPICSISGQRNGLTEKNLEHLLKGAGNGIFVTGFNGGNTNSSTGDFSFGIEGFYFENGTILYPVSGMNVTGNIILIWNSIIDIGNDPRKASRWLIPTLSFDSVDFNGF